MRGVTGPLALALALLAACGAQAPARPVSPAACQATAAHRVGSLQAIDADPAESTIRGLLDDGPTATAGRPFSLRWVMDARKAGKQLHMRAIREGTDQVIGATWTGSSSGDQAIFPARITFPAAGCWAADLSSGTADGEVVLRAD
jgi:hypothetical protein